jgi:hypothetical protein
LFLEDIDFLLFNLLDVASQDVVGIVESYLLRSRERHVVIRRLLTNALRALLGLRTNDVLQPLITVLHFSVSTFSIGCYFGTVFQDFGSKVFTAKGLGRGHHDTEV